jgi:hypothetical protein
MKLALTAGPIASDPYVMVKVETLVLANVEASFQAKVGLISVLTPY